MSKKKKSKAPAPEQPPVDGEEARTEQEPQTLEAQRDELLARLQRLAADYQNYQKRMAKDLEQARLFANESLMKELLPVLDDMERALAAARENHDEDDPLLTGTQLVHDNMLIALGKFGLVPIDAAGVAFDPEKHLALMQQPCPDTPPMTVMQELQPGYELKGRILRPSSVIVSKEPDQPDEGEAELAEETGEQDNADL